MYLLRCVVDMSTEQREVFRRWRESYRRRGHRLDEFFRYSELSPRDCFRSTYHERREANVNSSRDIVESSILYTFADLLVKYTRLLGSICRTTDPLVVVRTMAPHTTPVT